MDIFHMSSFRDGSDSSSGKGSEVKRGENSQPWLIHNSISGTVSHVYEPNIVTSSSYEENILSARIGTRQLSSDDLARVPKLLLVGRTSRGDVPAIMGWSTGPFIVNEQVREILENLEPGVQQFHPIAVKAKDGKPIKGHATLPYFILMLPPVLDCVDIDRTTWGDLTTGSEAFAKYCRLSSGKADIITLRADAIGGHHFWRWKGPTGFDFFASDELRVRLKVQSLRGWDFVKQCQIS